MAKTSTIALTFAVIILLALNVFQFYYFQYLTPSVAEEDVPMAISELNGKNWQNFIGRKVTVDGYYFKRGDFDIIVSNPELLFIDAPVGDDGFLMLTGDVSQAMESGSRYYVKGTVENATESDRIAPGKNIVLAYQSYKFVESSYTTFLESAYHIVVTASPQPIRIKYAVLVSGGLNPVKSYLRYWNDLKYMYSILINRYNYDPNNIIVMYKDGVAEDAEMPVNCSASFTNFQLVFMNLAAKIAADDYLFLFTNNHGGQTPDTNGDEPETTNKMDETLCLYYNSEVTDDQLANILDTITCYRMIIFMKQCFSGGFIHDLSASNRVIMTACTQDQTSWSADTEGSFGEFSYHFMKAVNNEVAADTDSNGWVSMAEAFNYAAMMDSRPETPQYDDNGDGLGHSGPIPSGGEGGLGNSYL
jgi:hypothetical protein